MREHVPLNAMRTMYADVAALLPISVNQSFTSSGRYNWEIRWRPTTEGDSFAAAVGGQLVELDISVRPIRFNTQTGGVNGNFNFSNAIVVAGYGATPTGDVRLVASSAAAGPAVQPRKTIEGIPVVLGGSPNYWKHLILISALGDEDNVSNVLAAKVVFPESVPFIDLPLERSTPPYGLCSGVDDNAPVGSIFRLGRIDVPWPGESVGDDWRMTSTLSMDVEGGGGAGGDGPAQGFSRARLIMATHVGMVNVRSIQVARTGTGWQGSCSNLVSQSISNTQSHPNFTAGFWRSKKCSTPEHGGIVYLELNPGNNGQVNFAGRRAWPSAVCHVHSLSFGWAAA